MKKLFVLLLALTVLAGAAFAQATINGYARARATWNTDAETFTLANRLRLNLGWTSEDGNVKFGARIQASDWTSATNMVVADYAYGKIKLADGKVVISGGRLWNFDYDISSGLSDYFIGNVANYGGYGYFDSVDGMLFQVMPVEGLNIGLLVTPDDADNGFNEFGLGVKYTIADIGDVVLTWLGANSFDASKVSASFVFTGVENLSAAVGYKGLADADTSIYGLFDYSMDALTFQIAPEFWLDASSFYIEGTVKYVMDAFTLMVHGAFDADNVNLTGDYFFGAELMYNMGKGQIALNPYYEDTVGFKLDIVTKVSF